MKISKVKKIMFVFLSAFLMCTSLVPMNSVSAKTQDSATTRAYIDEYKVTGNIIDLGIAGYIDVELTIEYNSSLGYTLKDIKLDPHFYRSFVQITKVTSSPKVGTRIPGDTVTVAVVAKQKFAEQFGKVKVKK